MSRLIETDQEWKILARRSLRSTAQMRAGERQLFVIVGAILALVLGSGWAIYMAPHMATEARHIYFSFPLIHIFVDNANEFAQQVMVLSTFLIVIVAYVVAFFVQTQIDEITRPARDKARREAKEGVNVRGLR